MFMAVLSVMFYVVIIAAVMGCVYYIFKPLTKDKWLWPMKKKDKSSSTL